MMEVSVLVVDDSPVQCGHAAEVCRAAGAADICSASNGDEAMLLLREQHKDIVLVDLEMPVMDGVELISHIAAEQLAKSIIVLSSKDASLIASVGTMAEAEGLAVLATIKKPVSKEVLEKAFSQFYLKTVSNIVSEQSVFDIGPTDLAKAICNNELKLHYQPKLTAKGLLLKGVEALARWYHPEYGYIPPVQFINEAEQKGLIGILTFHLLEQVLKQKMHWQQRGLAFNVAINLSPLSLVNEDFANWLSDLVASYKIRPSDLTLEVTENILFGDVAKSIQTLARLRLKGFMIAIDDYGTGFANAEQLSRVPATELKLDRTMINGVASKAQLKTILESTIQLAAKLGLTTVAEGVESAEDFEMLQELGVDLVQGYYFAKPISSEFVPEWIVGELKRLREKS